MKSVFGGSESKSESKSGFGQLPPEIQNAFKVLATNSQNMFANGAGDAMFRPMGQTAGEKTALTTLANGFAPTADSIASDIAMQQNPFDQYVLDGINREANGQNSILQKNLTAAGQFGSNRAALGANDIDLTRLQQIGQFKQSQFNNAMNNALTVLPQQRYASAQGQLQGGGYERNLDLQGKQAPVSALQAWAQIMGVLPKEGGSTSSSKSSSSPGFAGGLASLY